MITEMEAGDPQYRSLSADQLKEVCDWLRRVGVNPNTTHSVRLLDEGLIAVLTCEVAVGRRVSVNYICAWDDNWTEVVINEPPPEAWPYFWEPQ